MSLNGSSLTSLTGASPLNGAADTMIREAAPAGSAGGNDKAKAVKAGRDFEALLLGQWLQEAENTFAKLPGSDSEEDGDAGSSSMQGIAMQSLGQAMAASGGIGIARMIGAQLQRSGESAASPAPVPMTVVPKDLVR